MRRVFDTNDETQRLLGPTLLVYDSQLDHLAKLAGRCWATPSDLRGQDVRSLIAGLLVARPVQKAQQQAADAADTLAQASVSEQKQRLLILAFQLRRIIGELEKKSQTLDPKLRPLFLAQVEKFKPLVDGPSSIPLLRQQELALIADAGRLLGRQRHPIDAAHRCCRATGRGHQARSSRGDRVSPRHSAAEHRRDQHAASARVCRLDFDRLALCRPQYRAASRPISAGRCSPSPAVAARLPFR